LLLFFFFVAVVVVLKIVGCAAAEKTDLRKKLFGNIVLIGGSARLGGLGPFLQERITEAIGSKPDTDKVEVISKVRNIDPKYLSWRGAAVLSITEGTKECWIKASEWELFGIRALKDKALFYC
jgi:actin-related protein 8